MLNRAQVQEVEQQIENALRQVSELEESLAAAEEAEEVTSSWSRCTRKWLGW